MTYKVVVTDRTAADYDVEKQVFAEAAPDLDVTFLNTRDPATVLAATTDADAVILSWAPMTRDVIDGLKKCRLLCRYGIGVDMIDLDAATDHGIVVCNTARYCIDEVSTHAITFLLMLNREMLALADNVRASSSREARPPRRIKGQRLGLVGLGNIGNAVVAKARGLGLETVAFDPYLQKRQSEVSGTPLISLDEVLSTSDYVSIHCPLNTATHHLIGARELGLMKSSAFLINCARGAIVDQSALVTALTERRIAGAGLDVFEREPVPADDPIKALDNVIRTPHQAHWSVESSIECRRTAVEHVITFLKGDMPLDVVNRSVLEPGRRR